MARKDEAAELLRKGNSPKEIAHLMGISIGSVEQYLYTKVGEGTVRRSDILFSIDPELRKFTEDVIRKANATDFTQNLPQILRAAASESVSLDFNELVMYLKLRDARISLGDMYEFLYEIETTLHQMIKTILLDKYGSGETGWWRQGIHIDVRKECARMREEEVEPAAEPFCYTTFIHLSKIFSDQWAILSQVLPPPVVKDKKQFLSSLTRLNTIRNYVMHPVKGMPITEEDFAFVRDFHRIMQKRNWLSQPQSS